MDYAASMVSVHTKWIQGSYFCCLTTLYCAMQKISGNIFMLNLVYLSIHFYDGCFVIIENCSDNHGFHIFLHCYALLH